MPEEPVKAEKSESVVEVIPPEPEKQIVIEPETQKTEPKAVSFEDIQKIHKRMEHQARTVEKAVRDLNELTQRLQPSQPSQPQAGAMSQPLDEIDQIAERDWKQAVKMLGKKAAEELLIELSQKQQEEQLKQMNTNQLEASKARVLKKYPSISDETSDEARTYMEVMNEDPAILRNPMGPELAMYRMEERLNLKRPVTEVKQAVEQEVTRRTRIGAGALPPGRGTQSEDRIVLTQDEKDFCDRSGIPYSVYHKNRKLGEEGKFKEGVTYNG